MSVIACPQCQRPLGEWADNDMLVIRHKGRAIFIRPPLLVNLLCPRCSYSLVVERGVRFLRASIRFEGEEQVAIVQYRMRGRNLDSLLKRM